ncbi:MAG: DUF4347 domain-containing protein [Acidovorax sp.]
MSNTPLVPSTSARREVAFVDSRVDGIDGLLRDLGRDVEVVRIDATHDGLAQMAAALGDRGDVTAVHVLAHGSAGSLLLGSTVLDSNLAAHSAPLAAIGRAMAPGGDLLVYACNLAEGDVGAQFVSTLARLAGADVAASTDLTGSAHLGGNWALESHVGSIEASPLALGEYDGVLDVLSFVNGVDGGDVTPATSIGKTVSGHAITFSGPEMYIYDESPNDALYPYVSAGGEGVLMTIAVEAGYSFDINSFEVLAESGSMDFSITWADGTISGYTQTGVNDKGSRSTFSSFDTALNDMRSITVTSTKYTSFQNFNISDVKLLPPAAKVSSASLGTDTGISQTDFITNTASQLISGTLSANLGTGEKVQVSYDNGSSWSDATTYTEGTKAWSTTTTLAGSNTFLARVANADAASTAFSHTYALDIVSPTTTFGSIALSSDTGFSNTDFITRTASQTISATLSGAPAGSDTVWGSTNGGSNWTNITSKVSGTSLTWTGATLSAGNNSVMFKVTDSADNDSSLSFQNYTLDTTAPGTTIATASFSNDSGTSGTDFITNTASQTISGTLSANMVVGDRVYVSRDNGASWSAATTTVGNNTWSLGGVSLVASNTLNVKVSDTAGNDGDVLSQVYTYDTTAPTITFSNLTLSADTGASSTDFITKTASQTIGATLSNSVMAGDILYGSLDNGAHWTDITSKLSRTTLSWNGVTLAGSNTLQLKVVDAAGNEGTPHSKAYTLDTSTPATPGTPDLSTASDTGTPNNDNITLDTTPTFSGTAENGSTVTLYDGATVLGTVIAGAGGWTYTTGVLTQGSHTITAVSTDTAGNVSATSAGLTITVDTSAPTVTSVTVPPNGTYYANGVLDFTVSFSEAVIVDSFGGTPRIALTVGSTTRHADYVSGSSTSALLFRYTVPSGDIDANGITVGALSANGGLLQDAAGNDAVTTLNSVGSTAAVNVDGNQASVTGVSASTPDGSYGTTQTITITVAFSSAVDVDTTGGTPTLALASGGSAVYVGGTGTSTLTFSYAVGAGQNSADLDYSSTSALMLNGATIIEAGGAHQNAALTLATPGTAGSLGANKDIVIDTAAPTNTVDSAAFLADTGTSGSDFITKTAAQTVSGTLTSNLAAGERVYVSLDDGGTWTLAASAVGTDTWSLVGQTLSGSNTLKVRVSDAAGNHGTAYWHTYAIDNTAPTPNGAAGTPADNAGTAPTSGAIVLPFSEALDALSDLSKVYLRKVGTPGNIAATVTLNSSGHLVITPASALAEGTAYHVNWDANALVDTAGNYATAVTDNTTYNFTTVAAAAPATPPATTVDGVPVTTEPGPGGSTITTIPVVVSTRPDVPGTSSPLADIPLVKGPDGQPIVQVSVPTGVGLQAEGLAGTSTGSAALAELGFRIERVAGTNPELINAGQVFFASMPPNEPLSVQILKPTAGAGFDPNVPLVITGSTNPADGKQAVIIDARSLPAGSVIQVDNIEFVAVVGNVRLIGGAGQNVASGDGGAQWIVLGPDDDVIHGGAGNDTVGSEAGDDQVYGDAGDDIVFGGAGNDLLSGGTGSDRLNGGTGFDVAIQEGARTDYTVTLEGAGIKLTHTASGVSDWLVDVEQVRFATGPSLTVAHSAAEEAAAYLFQKWIGRELNQSEGAAIQTLAGQSAEQVATLFAQVFPQQSAGKTPAQLLEGMAGGGAIRVDAVRDVIVSGDAGNNTITPTLGLARYVDGGAGIDTVVIPATLGQTFVQHNASGSYTLQRLTEGAMLDVSNVERVTLTDTKLALDINGNAGEAAKLLGALGGPAILANKGVVGEVIRALDAGASSQTIAGLGLQLLGVSTPTQIAQTLWTNVVGRAGTAPELKILTDIMAGGVSAADLVVMAAHLDANATRIDLVGLAAKGIEFA